MRDWSAPAVSRYVWLLLLLLRVRNAANDNSKPEVAKANACSVAMPVIKNSNGESDNNFSSSCKTVYDLSLIHI